MRKLHAVPWVAGAVLLLATPVFAASKSEEAREKSIEMSSVPKPAMDAATKALGSAPTEAKIISGTTPQQYELEARNTSGGETAVHVRADGTIVKRETESAEHERAEH